MNVSITDAAAVLFRTPATLGAMLGGLADVWIRATEGEGKWSPYDVLGHLVHGEKADWIPRIRHILDGRTDQFEPFDRDAQFVDSDGKSLGDLLEEFAKLRQQNVAALIGFNLTDDDLALPGVHPQLGNVTLGQLVATWVVHDLDHIAQISRTMAKVYTGATGPWRKYLSVLEDRR